MHTRNSLKEWVFWHKSAFCSLRTESPFPPFRAFLSRLIRGWIALDSHLYAKQKTWCNVSNLPCNSYAKQATLHQTRSSCVYFTRNTFPTSPHPQPIIYMRTITNEGVVEQEPGTVVPLSSHLVQVRWGRLLPAAPYTGKKMGHRLRGGIC